MQSLFFDLVDYATTKITGSEILLANFAGEQSDFVRFNRGRVRQPGSVQQAYLTLTLIDGRRRDAVTLSLSGDQSTDRAAVDAAMMTLRRELTALPEDPYLLYSTEPTQSERIEAGTLPDGQQAIDVVVRAADGDDLVGILASGPVQRGFASSIGHRHWHQVASFMLDWSVYLAGDKAVKSSFAAAQWSDADIEARISKARDQVPHLARPVRSIEPGSYRAYLAPAAFDEVIGMLNWSGVSAKAQRTKTSCLQKLVDGDATLSPRFTLREHTGAGLAPAFDEVGFARPAQIDIVRAGQLEASMVSARTAHEYGIASNGADEDEALHSSDVEAGALDASDALRALDTGIYVSNLWYLNFSDQSNARITGMTRFASFWVEQSRVVAPLSVMRFDDSLFRMLGTELLELTRERDWIVSANSYGQRSVDTSRVPGALLGSLRFTL
jgi:predicted Zn-dependent protease